MALGEAKFWHLGYPLKQLAETGEAKYWHNGYPYRAAEFVPIVTDPIFVTQQAMLTGMLPTDADLRATQQALLTGMLPSDANARVTQTVLLIGYIAGKIYISQQATLAGILPTDAKARLSQIAALTGMLPSDAKARATQLALLVGYVPTPTRTGISLGLGSAYGTAVQVFHRTRPIGIYISNRDRTEFVEIESAKWSRSVNEQASAEFTLIDRGLGFVPGEGESIEILRNLETSPGVYETTVLFSGFIFERKIGYVNGFTGRFFGLKCADYTSRIKRFNYVRAFDPQPGGAIIRDILLGLGKNVRLDDGRTINRSEGIDVTGVEDGPDITAVLAFDMNNPWEAIQKVCAITGYRFKMVGRYAFYSEFTEVEAPFNITATNGTVTDISFTRSLSDIRTVQVVRFSQGATTDGNTDEDVFDGDGIQNTFFCKKFFAQGSVPEVYLDDVRLNLGELKGDGLDTGAECFYAPTGFQIYFFQLTEVTNIIPPEGSVLRVKYRGVAPGQTGQPNDYVVAGVTDEEFEERAAIDGGSGVWMQVTQEQTITNPEIALQLAEGLLRKNKTVQTIADFTTYEWDLDPGMFIHIDMDADTEGDYFIDNISSSWSQLSTGDLVTTTVQATTGERIDKAMQSLAKIFENSEHMGKPGQLSQGGLTDETAQRIEAGRYALANMPKGKVEQVFVNEALVPRSEYTVEGNEIIFNTPPADDAVVRSLYSPGGPGTIAKKARQFDTDSMVSFGFVFPFYQEVSVGLWVKFENTSEGVIFTRAAFGAATEYNSLYQLSVVPSGVNGDGVPVFDLEYGHESGVSVGTNHTFNTNIPANVWTWIAISRNPVTPVVVSGVVTGVAKTVSLYVGSSLNEKWTYTTNPDNGDDPTYQAFTIGGVQKVGTALTIHPGTGFRGRIERFYLANKAWTAEQQQAAMQGNPDSSGLKLKLIMGTTPEVDVSGSGLVGSIVGPGSVVIDSH